MIFCTFNFLKSFGVFANQPTEHNGVSRRRVCRYGCWLYLTEDWWQVICDAPPSTHDRWHMTPDTWHVTPDMQHPIFSYYTSFFQPVLVLVILSAHIERFSVSRMKDFWQFQKMYFYAHRFIQINIFINIDLQTLSLSWLVRDIQSSSISRFSLIRNLIWIFFAKNLKKIFFFFKNSEMFLF